MSTAPLPPSPSQDASNRANPGQAGGPAAFGRLITEAVLERGRVDVPTWALASGELAPQLLCGYAVGQVNSSERQAVQELLVRHPWAANRVTRLVQGTRPDADAPLANAIATAARAGAVDPYRIAATLALRSLDAPTPLTPSSATIATPSNASNSTRYPRPFAP
jgi:hypothetical protein